MLKDLEEEYQASLNQESDINQHLPTLRALAMECDSITEFGVRSGESTRAFLVTGKKLRSYDIYKYGTVIELFSHAQELGHDVEYISAHVLYLDIENTDMLFIDTLHCYPQLRDELLLHAGKVNKYIALHDTVTYGHRDEVELHRYEKIGLIPAVEEFLEQNSDWHIKHHYENNNGLMVLERK